MTTGPTIDANGNTLSDGQGRSYTWDFENRLTQAINPGVRTTTFRYDPFGRRIQKSGPLGTTNYLYDGANLIEEVDSGGNELARYAQTAKIDEQLSELRSNTASYYETDALGSVTSLSNASATISSTYIYDSFGNLSGSTGTTGNPFRYTGREFDTETGIYYYRARYYDPLFGRFVSEDRMRFSVDENFYRYVYGDPVNLIDPLGLDGGDAPGDPGTEGCPGGYCGPVAPTPVGPAGYTLKPGIPTPSLALDALLRCIQRMTGIPLVVTSTSEPPPLSPHGPNDPHRRNGGLAVDVRYPSNSDSVLNAAACCGARNALDEKKHPSKHATAPHLHLQLVPGPNPNNPSGDLPKNPICKGCQ